MNPESMYDPGTYVDSETGDIWELKFSGQWTVNGMPHKPFPMTLVPEQGTPVDQTIPTADEIVDDYDNWRSIPYFPWYEIRRDGAVRYKETKVILQPSVSDRLGPWYHLMTEQHTVRLVRVNELLDTTYPDRLSE